MVKDYFMAFESIWAWHTHLSTKYGKMDIRKVKADQLTLLVCLPHTLSLVSMEEEASKICVELFGNIYFIYLIPN